MSAAEELAALSAMGAAAINLHQTFRAYVVATNAASVTFIKYQRGRATEADVRRAQQAVVDTSNAHLDAINAIAGVTVT